MRLQRPGRRDVCRADHRCKCEVRWDDDEGASKADERATGRLLRLLEKHHAVAADERGNALVDDHDGNRLGDQ